MESPVPRRPRSASSPPSPGQVGDDARASQQVSPLNLVDRGSGGVGNQPNAARTELVWCTKREAVTEAYPALRHTHHETERQGVFLLGKVNPGQLLLLPEADRFWDISPLGQSWTQAARVVSPISGYPEAFATALLQVILEGRLMNGERLSWTRWLQNYPPRSEQVSATLSCRLCQTPRRLPLFALLSAPSEQATFVCAGASRQCEVPNTEVCPWVAWDAPTPPSYNLAEDTTSTTHCETPTRELVQSPSTSSALVLQPHPVRTPEFETAVVRQSRSSSRHVGISRVPRASTRPLRRVRSRQRSRSTSESQRLRRRSNSPSISPLSTSSGSRHTVDSDLSPRRRHSHHAPAPTSMFDPFGRSEPRPRHFILGWELRNFHEAGPSRTEEREALAMEGRSNMKREQRDFDKWVGGFL